MADRKPRVLGQTRQFVRDYTAGLNVRDVKRLFDRDAAEAYRVLARDQGQPEAPKEPFRRFLFSTRVLFMGVSQKLTPARRILFLAALVFLVIGMLKPSLVEVHAIGLFLTVGTGALWYMTGAGLLLFLLVMELVDRVRFRDELEVAKQLQSDLLPQAVPRAPGYRFAHSYRTANEVGGDYYDFLDLPDGRLALLAGDASGHGIAAGLLMAISNATLKTALDVDPDPIKVATLLNRSLFRSGDRRAFMTLFYGLLEPASGRLDFVCAGHPFPIVRRAGGRIEELGSGGLPLGIRESVDLEAGTTTLGRGDLLVLYTDGLPEAIGGAEARAFGFDRLKRLVAAPGSPAAVHDRILAAFDEHTAGEPLHDDLTLVVIGRLPEAGVKEIAAAEPPPPPPPPPPTAG